MSKVQEQTLKILAENVRAYRAKVGISQDELAHICGLHRTYVGAIERAERNVTIATLTMLAHVMKVEVSSLITKGGVK
jgi:transcriptional regulator with XRE-family HTH domain